MRTEVSYCLLYSVAILTRLGTNLVQGSVFFWVVPFRRFEVWFCSMNLGSGGSKFKGFIPIPNGKFTHILIFYEVRTSASIRGSVFIGRFGGLKFSF